MIIVQTVCMLVITTTNIDLSFICHAKTIVLFFLSESSQKLIVICNHKILSPFSNEAFSGVKGNQFSSPDDFLYSASLDNIKMIIIFKSPEVGDSMCMIS